MIIHKSIWSGSGSTGGPMAEELCIKQVVEYTVNYILTNAYALPRSTLTMALSAHDGKVLTDHRVYLVDNLHTGPLLEVMYSYGVIRAALKEQIANLPDRRFQNQRLVDILMSNSQERYDVFMDALYQTNQDQTAKVLKGDESGIHFFSCLFRLVSLLENIFIYMYTVTIHNRIVINFSKLLHLVPLYIQ